MNIHLHSRAVAYAKQCKSILIIAAAGMLLTSCHDENIFVSNFDTNTLNQPPAANQKVGTITIDAQPGKVIIAPSPISVAGKWAKAEKTNQNDPNAGYTCHNSKIIGQAEYRFTASLFIPHNTGLVTIDFQSADGPKGSFLHIDFLQNGHVRLQDKDEISALTFPKDNVFIIQVTLYVENTDVKVHLALTGGNMQSSYDYTITDYIYVQFAKRYAATELFIGFPWVGPFYATNIVTAHVQ